MRLPHFLHSPVAHLPSTDFETSASTEQQWPPRHTTQEIQERLLFGLVNEAFKVLEEGICEKPSDLDVIYVFGYGFPGRIGGAPSLPRSFFRLSTLVSLTWFLFLHAVSPMPRRRISTVARAHFGGTCHTTVDARTMSRLARRPFLLGRPGSRPGRPPGWHPQVRATLSSGPPLAPFGASRFPRRSQRASRRLEGPPPRQNSKGGG